MDIILENMSSAVLTVKELGKYLNVGSNRAYQLTHSEGFPVLRIGKKILIPRERLHEWINRVTENKFLGRS